MSTRTLECPYCGIDHSSAVSCRTARTRVRVVTHKDAPAAPTDTIAQQLDSPARPYHLTWRSTQSGREHTMSFSSAVSRAAWIVGLPGWAEVVAVTNDDVPLDTQ